MKFELVQFSIVVVGKAHNPTILNPDFLSIRKIVPEEWGWKVAPHPISTPPFALVRYENGVSIVVEPDKMQASDPGVSDNPLHSKIPEIARSYVKTLPHVQYTAVGINFHGIVEVQSPEAYLKDRFLKKGPWDSSTYPLNSIGIQLVYLAGDGGRLVLSLDIADISKVKPPGRHPQHVIIANGNFHRDCQGYPAEEQVIIHLSKVSNDWSMYQEILKRALEDKG